MIGKKFHELGVGHVICVDKEHELDDEAAVIFSNQFYGQLFSNQGSTICEAYHSAIHTLRDAKPSAEEKRSLRQRSLSSSLNTAASLVPFKAPTTSRSTRDRLLSEEKS